MRPVLRLPLAAALVTVAGAAGAQVISLDEVVVSSGTEDVAAAPSAASEETGEPATQADSGLLTQGAEEAFRAPSGTTVITRQTIARDSGRNISDALQTAPGVIAPTSADDPGVAINIRGLQDHGRVAVTVDGARQNFARSGHAANGTVTLDQRMIKSVTVNRGPTAVVGGSAIGGTVAFETIDAGDVLRGDETVAGRLESTVETNGPGGVIHGEFATRIGTAFDVLAAGTFGKGADYQDGDGETIRSADQLTSGLLKARLRLAEGHETTLSAMRIYNTSRTAR